MRENDLAIAINVDVQVLGRGGLLHNHAAFKRQDFAILCFANTMLQLSGVRRTPVRKH